MLLLVSEPRKWLTATRIQKGHTLKSLAAVTGVSPSFICKLEKGIKNPSGTVAKKLSRELEIKMELFWPEV